MSDQITAKGSDAQFAPHPEGQFVGQCVDTIALGDRVEQYAGSPDKVVPKCALVFRTGEKNPQTGEWIDIAREFTISMGEKANLRKFLEQWRGKPYESAQIDAGVPIDKLTGNHGLLTIAWRKSGKGRTYANITACVGIPKQMASSVTRYEDYVRADYWETRKKEYAEEAARWRSDQRQPTEDFNDFPEALKDDPDDLPF